MLIVFHPDTLELHGHRISTGVIYFEHDGVAFPSNDWNDFPDAILLAWINMLFQLRQREANEITLHFMDGPFAAQLFRTPDGFWGKFLANDKPANVTFSFDLDELIESAIQAGVAFGTKAGNKTVSPDARKLAAVVDKLITNSN